MKCEARDDEVFEHLVNDRMYSDETRRMEGLECIVAT